MDEMGFGGAAPFGLLAGDDDEEESVPPAAAQADAELSYEPLPAVSGFELGGV